MAPLPSVSTVRQFVGDTMRPALEALGDTVGIRQQMASREAITTLTAIGLQESNLTFRRQIVGGKPVGRARGLWQTEPKTAGDILRHPKVKALPNIETALAAVGLTLDMSPAKAAARIEADDKAACVLARLLLWTDDGTLTLDQEQAWATYLRVWRPGAPRPKDWPACWKLANDSYFERSLAQTMRGAGMAIAGVATAAGTGPAIVEMGRNLRDVGLGDWWRVTTGLVIAGGIVLTTYGLLRARRRPTEQG